MPTPVSGGPGLPSLCLRLTKLYLRIARTFPGPAYRARSTSTEVLSGSLGHWTRTASEAIGVARQILELDPLPEQPPFFWSDQFGLRLQLVGHPNGADRVEVEGSDDEFVARYLAKDGSLLAALAANRPTEVGKLRKELALAA